MRRLAANIAIFTAAWALAACGGAGGSSAVTPTASQNAQAGAPGSAAHIAEAAANRRIASLLRTKVKHVFVLVQENHTFDQLFGLFPGDPGQYVENLGTYLAQ